MSSEIQSIYANRKLNWAIISVLVVLHAGAIAALFMFSWRAFIVAVVLYWVSVGLGISMGYHRLHTHRSYKLPRALEYFLAFCGTLVAGRRPDLLGGDAPHPSSIFGQARRSAFASAKAPGGRISDGCLPANPSTTTPS